MTVGFLNFCSLIVIINLSNGFVALICEHKPRHEDPGLAAGEEVTTDKQPEEAHEGDLADQGSSIPEYGYMGNLCLIPEQGVIIPGVAGHVDQALQFCGEQDHQHQDD